MGNFIAQFQNHFQSFHFAEKTQFLVAVSGGIDSMVLCELLRFSGISFAIAHCNFQLRGKDSDEDAAFVQTYAAKHQTPFYVKEFDVKTQKESGNYSTQMAARDLRYAWFQELMQKEGFDYLLTAHHAQDNFETFLINLSRGSGLEGLTGIKNLQNQIFRPLLPFSKKEILEFAQENSIEWREDISNASDDYVRNRIRHKIMPVLEEIHPQFLMNFQKSIAFLQADQMLIQNHLNSIRKEIFKESPHGLEMEIEKLKGLNPLSSYLHYLFEDFGFQHTVEIEKLIHSSQNGEIQSKTHRLIKDRNRLILVSREILGDESEILIDPNQIIEKPLYLRFSKSGMRDDKANETIDADKIQFPLKLRKMKTGDIFFPLGMKGSKKLSKYFKDEKFSKLDKENTWLMVDEADSIIYVVGKRLDDRFKWTKNTHNFLNIYLC